MTDTDPRTELAAVLWPPRVGLSTAQIEQLLKPLNPRRVKNRSQGGQTLSYLGQEDVRAHMTRMFGFANWSSEVVQTRHLFEEQVPALRNGEPVVDTKTGEVKTNWYCAWQATVKLTVKDANGNVLAEYSDVAIGGNTQPQRHEANDMSLKTAVSDALKRAATNLGDQFGLSLYQKNASGPIVKAVLVGDPADQKPGDTPENAAKMAHAIGLQGDDPANERLFIDVPLPSMPDGPVPTPFDASPTTTVSDVHDSMRTAVAATRRPSEATETMEGAE
jgi:hypothetical protein